MKKEKIKILKGEYRYIDTQKKRQLIKTIIAFLIAAAIFVVGLALNKWEKNNIFTIIAAVAVLPAAKMLIRYILFIPYKTAPLDFHKKIVEILGEKDYVLEDIIFTTSQKVMGFLAVVVTNHKILVRTSKIKDDKNVLEKMLGTATRAWGFSNKVVAYDNDETFFKELSRLDSTELAESDEVKELISQLKILIP